MRLRLGLQLALQLVVVCRRCLQPVVAVAYRVLGAAVQPPRQTVPLVPQLEHSLHDDGILPCSPAHALHPRRAATAAAAAALPAGGAGSLPTGAATAAEQAATVASAVEPAFVTAAVTAAATSAVAVLVTGVAALAAFA